MNKYKCPCCGYYTFPVPRQQAISYICPVCLWENDLFTSDDNEPSDCNHGLTLNQGRENFRKFGACEKNMICHARKPHKDELKDID